MAGRLAHITKAFDKRMALRRQMMDVLGVCPTAEDAPGVQDDLRASLLACGGCRNTDVCEAWLNQPNHDTPLFCAARPAFFAIKEKLEPV